MAYWNIRETDTTEIPYCHVIKIESRTSLSLPLGTGMGTWQDRSVGYGAWEGMASCHTHLLLFLSRSFLRLWLCSQSLFLHFLSVNERQKIIHWAVINHSCICRRLFLLLYRLMRLRKKTRKSSPYLHEAATLKFEKLPQETERALHKRIRVRMN